MAALLWEGLMALRAELKGLWSIDLPQGPPELPVDPENCWVNISADIGTVGDPGADEFSFIVTTPKFLATEIHGSDYRLGRELIIVEAFRWEVIEKAIERLVHTFSGETWEELATKLGRYAYWEFEDYQPFTESK